MCPQGVHSWCKYQSHKALGKTICHGNPLPESTGNILKPLFEQLSSKNLLKKCSKGLTQNLNKALSFIFWCFGTTALVP